jgi:hypothetical protein
VDLLGRTFVLELDERIPEQACGETIRIGEFAVQIFPVDVRDGTRRF